MISKTTLALLFAALAAAGPVQPREVASLNAAATAEAHPRDNTATRAFSNVQIKTSNGKCLSVDPLSGDFRANLTPIQITDCGSNAGQGWDVITSGVHNNQKGQALIVSTLTQACFNFDPRRAAGNQVLLFSCGGRADGSGQVTNSQLFAFTGGNGPLSLTPGNDPTKCFVAKGNVVDIADCNKNDAAQQFTFGSAAAAGGSGKSNGKGGNNNNNGKGGKNNNSSVAASSAAATSKAAAVTSAAAAASSAAAPADDQNAQCSAPKIVTVTEVTTVTAGAPPPAEASSTADNSAAAVSTTAAAAATSSAAVVVNPGEGNSQTTAAPPPPAITGNPTTPVPVSGAGGTLNPSAVAEAQKFDADAVRPLESVNIRAADGRCFFVNPTAGDFRENLIPVGLAKCSEDASQKFDIVTKGVHDDAKAGEALIVSVLTNGCLNFDGRRAANDQVIMFSCGGRADGSGQTATSQLFPFKAGSNNIVLTPNSDSKTCLVAGADRVESAQCNGQKGQTFELVEIL